MPDSTDAGRSRRRVPSYVHFALGCALGLLGGAARYLGDPGVFEWTLNDLASALVFGSAFGAAAGLNDSHRLATIAKSAWTWPTAIALCAGAGAIAALLHLCFGLEETISGLLAVGLGGVVAAVILNAPVRDP